MTDRGQRYFINLPGFVVRLYAALTNSRSIQHQYSEIAADLTAQIETGHILDVGTGPGYLLTEIHRLKPAFALYGVDISPAMVDFAKKRLGSIPVDLRVADIRRTDYQDDFFDLVTCTASFYLWGEPEKGLAEVYRILKAGGSAYLFETYRDHEPNEVQNAIHRNLYVENWLRRSITPCLFMRQLQMTYTTNEIVDIVKGSPFASNFEIEKIVLAGLPVWLRIKLLKN